MKTHRLGVVGFIPRYLIRHRISCAGKMANHDENRNNRNKNMNMNTTNQCIHPQYSCDRSRTVDEEEKHPTLDLFCSICRPSLHSVVSL